MKAAGSSITLLISSIATSRLNWLKSASSGTPNQEHCGAGLDGEQIFFLLYRPGAPVSTSLKRVPGTSQRCRLPGTRRVAPRKHSRYPPVPSRSHGRQCPIISSLSPRSTGSTTHPGGNCLSISDRRGRLAGPSSLALHEAAAGVTSPEAMFFAEWHRIFNHRCTAQESYGLGARLANSLNTSVSPGRRSQSPYFFEAGRAPDPVPLDGAPCGQELVVGRACRSLTGDLGNS